jgi:glycine/D-amino acid oxidase-like deaminating enzyme
MAVSPKAKAEFLIVGQGLAGSLLGWQLIQQGRSVLIIDPCHEQTTSRAAAGLINPVTGKRLVKTINVEQYLPAAKSLYSELSDFFGETFLHDKKQVKLFKSEDEIAQWEKRKSQADYGPFLGECIHAKDKEYLSNDSFGGFEQKQCGYLDTVSLLDRLRAFFEEQDCFINSEVDLDELIIGEQSVQWRDYSVDKIVFCDGYQLQNNRWFSWLPLQPVQGEIFTLKSEQQLPEEIIQFGKWLLPLLDGQFKLGATWQWSPLDEQPTEKAETELLDACKKQFPKLQNARLIEKKVGIRPGTRDKQPFIGSHPYQPRLMIFNGFGSKGSLMIPWYSALFSRYLIKGGNLPETVDIKRYIDGCPLS